MPETSSQQPPDPMTDGTFPDFPPRADTQHVQCLPRSTNNQPNQRLP